MSDVDRWTVISTHIICTTAPQPENASLSTAFKRVCDIVSKSSSGSYRRNIPRWKKNRVKSLKKIIIRTKSGSHNPSATPNSSSLAVPATTKSFAKLRQPIRSAAAINGLEPREGLLIPAITGSMKKGPNLHQKVSNVREKTFVVYSPPFIKRRANKVSECIWLYFTLFFDGIHVDAETKAFAPKS